MKEMQSKETEINIFYVIAALAVIVVGAFILWFFVFRAGEEAGQKISTAGEGAGTAEAKKFSAEDALTIALREAKKWRSDAELARVNSGAVNEKGQSSVWSAIFVSQSLKGKGYEVKVNGQDVISAKEILYTAEGTGPLPRLISAEEAIVEVREIKGYENAEILGVEAVYEKDGDIWYWGVKVPWGVVNIKARK